MVDKIRVSDITNKCDICRKNTAIGVACTIIPYSCFYCAECAVLNAQPEVVFLTLFDDVGVNFNKLAEGFADGLLTYHNDKYMTYREWATLKNTK